RRSPEASRSFISVVMATPQPPPTPPSRWPSGMRVSVKYTSLKCEAPEICLMRRVSMPGDFIDRKKNVSPLCLPACGSLRATRMAQSAQCAPEVQIFWPLTTQSSPSRTARVRRPARSEPAPGQARPRFPALEFLGALEAVPALAPGVAALPRLEGAALFLGVGGEKPPRLGAERGLFPGVVEVHARPPHAARASSRAISRSF